MPVGVGPGQKALHAWWLSRVAPASAPKVSRALDGASHGFICRRRVMGAGDRVAGVCGGGTGTDGGVADAGPSGQRVQLWRGPGRRVPRVGFEPTLNGF